MHPTAPIGHRRRAARLALSRSGQTTRRIVGIAWCIAILEPTRTLLVKRQLIVLVQTDLQLACEKIRYLGGYRSYLVRISVDLHLQAQSV